jgi:hypothetical protein
MSSAENERPADENDLANVPPTPMQNDPWRDPFQDDERGSIGSKLGTVFIVGTGVFLLVSALMPSVQGATRSAKLKWQEQQAEMQKAETDANTHESATE